MAVGKRTFLPENDDYLFEKLFNNSYCLLLGSNFKAEETFNPLPAEPYFQLTKDQKDATLLFLLN